MSPTCPSLCTPSQAGMLTFCFLEGFQVFLSRMINDDAPLSDSNSSTQNLINRLLHKFPTHTEGDIVDRVRCAQEGKHHSGKVAGRVLFLLLPTILQYTPFCFPSLLTQFDRRDSCVRNAVMYCTETCWTMTVDLFMWGTVMSDSPTQKLNAMILAEPHTDQSI